MEFNSEVKKATNLIYEKISDIMPEINDSKNVLIAAHGNSLRSLVKFIEDLNETDILKLEIATGEPIIYKFIDGRFTRA